MAGIDYSWITPELANNPSAAVDVAKSADPHTTGQVVSHSLNGVIAKDVVADHAANNDSVSFWNKAGVNVFAGLNFLAKPLQEVQRDYRFIHSVTRKHGLVAGFLASIGTVAGGVAGTFLGPEGTVIGAELGSTLSRKVLGNIYKDSYADSENPDYKVSAGRDFTNAFAGITDALGADGIAKALRNTNKGIGKFVSGISDATFDIAADPLNVVAKFNMALKSGKYLTLPDKAVENQLKYPLMNRINGIQNFLESRSLRVTTPAALDALKEGTGVVSSSANYNRALDTMAGFIKNSNTMTEAAGKIAQEFPELGTQVPFQMVSRATTADEIHNFLRDTVYFGELQGTLAGGAVMPSRTLLRAKGLTPAQKFLRGDDLNPNELKWYNKGYKTFSGYMPFSIDPVTRALSTESFRWNSPDATSVIYRIARFGMGHDAAADFAGQYAQAVATQDVGLAKAIKSQVTFDSFKAMGLPDDNVLVINAKRELDNLDKHTVGNQVYGGSPTGDAIGQYTTLDGTASVAGLDETQYAREFSIPNFVAAKNALREAGRVSKYLGKLDEFTADVYTNKIFKPLALATLGFGLRVSASELIPAVARYGILNVFKAKLSSSAAKHGYNLSSGEGKHVAAAALTALGAAKGITPDAITMGFPAFRSELAKGLAKVAPEDQLQYAIDLMLANKGHITSEGVRAGAESASTRYDMENAAHSWFQQEKRKLQYRDTGEFTTYTADSPHFMPMYITQLKKLTTSQRGKNIASDAYASFVSEGLTKATLEKEIGNTGHEAYQKIRQELIDKEYARIMATKRGEYEPYAIDASLGERWTRQDPKQFAADRVDSVLGSIIGKDGTVHTDIAKAIGDGAGPDLEYLRGLSNQELPAVVAGNQIEAIIPGGGNVQKAISSFVNLGFKKLIDPVINGISREPLYLIHFSNEMESLKYMVNAGELDYQAAVRTAQYRATHAMLPQIHNTALRTQFSQLARNFMPFYFAQEQAIKRAYKVAKETSVGSAALSRSVRLYQMVEQGMSNPAFVNTDANGNSYAYLPMVGEFGKMFQQAAQAFGVNMIAGLPIAAQGSMTSMKTVVPGLELPGLSPIVAIPANVVADIFPQVAAPIEGGLGLSANRGVWESLVPSKPLYNVWNALGPDQQNAAMINATFGAMASAYYHNPEDFQPNMTVQQKEAVIDRIRNNAKSILIIKAITGMLSPLAPRVEQTDVGLRDEFVKMVKSTGDYGLAMQTFLKEHGDRAVSYTVAHTTPAVRGASFPYTQKAIDWIDKELGKGGLLSNPDTAVGAMFLVPQDPGAGNTLAIHHQLIRDHLRENRTPQEFLDQFFIIQGNNYIAPYLEQHTQNVNTFRSMQNSFLLQQENQNWSAFMSQLKNTMPTWYDNYSSGGGRNSAALAVQQLQSIFSTPGYKPKTEQEKLVMGLMQDYQAHNATIEQYKNFGITGQLVDMENQNWSTYLENLKASDQRLQSVINSVFSKV